MAREAGCSFESMHEALRALVVRGEVEKIGERFNVLWTLKEAA